MVTSIRKYSSEELIGTVDFALIAIREDEFEAVLHFFPPTAEAKGKQRTYEISDFKTADGNLYRAAIVRSIEQGHSAAQSTASDVIADLNPSWIVLVGIAGGLPETEFSLGDVVIATRMIDFSVSAALQGGGKETAHRGSPAHKAVQDIASRLSALKPRLGGWNQPERLGAALPSVLIDDDHLPTEDDDWKDKIRTTLEHRFSPVNENQPRHPIVIAAPIASGNVLMKDIALVKEWLKNARDLKAVEMEMPGVYEAAHRMEGDIPVLTIRGISDIVGFKRDPAWTSFACKTAASLARALLDLNIIDLRPKQPPDVVIKELKKIVSDKVFLGSGAIAEHHGEDAQSTLNAILRRRATPGQDALKELLELARHLGNEGKFAAAPNSVKAQVYDWVARVAANKGDVVESERALAKLGEMSHQASPSALAWNEVAHEKVDDALRILRSLDSAESRSGIFGILRVKRGVEDALGYFDSLENSSPDMFTAVGWVNIVVSLLEKGRIEQVTSLLSSLPDTLLIECPYLGYIRGLSYLANSVSEDFRDRLFNGDYLMVNRHLLDGDDAESWRRKAYDSFEKCSKAAENAGDELLVGRSEHLQLWLRLVDPARKDMELIALIDNMNDGLTAVNLMPLAYAFNVKFDASAITRYLERTEILGGLSPEELNAKVLLLQHLEHFAELAAFILDNWGRLAEVGSSAVLGGTLIQAYALAGECALAEETLKAKREELYPLDVARFELMIQHCRGEDPTRQAKENYEASGAIEDLENLVRGLEGARRWAELTPYALELFRRESNVVNAQRYVECLRITNAPDADVVRFLDDWPNLVDRAPELMSARAWALFHLGEVEESQALNNRLHIMRKNVNDLSLDINLAVRMGDWEKLPAILDREWTTRGELPVWILLNLAQLTSSSAKVRALQLVRECSEREPNNPQSLLQAYSIAAAMARDDIAMPLMHKAAQLSKDSDGPVRSMSFTEVVEMLNDSAEGWRKKNDLFRSGSIPLHWAAGMFNIPLSRLLIAIPRENKDQVDARRRQPIPIVSGNRHPLVTSDVKRLALDITSIFILSELGYLERIINVLDETFLSPRFMEMLLSESEKVRFHQPSRIDAAKPLLELHRKGLFKLVETKGPSDLIAEVGEEDASLLAAAKFFKGLWIHSGKVYRAGSYMDKEAQLGDFTENLASPAVVAQALYSEGSITLLSRDNALEYLNLVSAGEMSGAALGAGAPVFLDRVSVQHLSEAKLLNDLVKSSRHVFIHPDAIEEWQALANTEPHSEAIVGSLEGMRRTIKEGITKGKIRFLREGKLGDDERRFGISVLPIMDLFEDVSRVDAVCIDDRFLNSQHIFEDRNGKKVDLYCSLDVIDMLVERKVASATERAETIHSMREWCLSALPLEAKELFELLLEKKADEMGSLVESAKLRVIREYIARLHSSDFLCTTSDLEYLDNLWRTGQKVIRDLWADEKSEIANITARANWVVDHVIPDIELGLRFAPDGKVRMEDIALARLTAALLPVGGPNGLNTNYTEWVERKIIASYLPACSNLIDKASKQMGAWVIDRSKGVANEFGKDIDKEVNEGNAGVDIS